GLPFLPLAGPATVRAGNRVRPLLRPASTTGSALLRCRDMDLSFPSSRSLLRGQIQVVPQSDASRRICPWPSPPSEELSEDAGQIAESPSEEIPEQKISHEIVGRPPFAHTSVTGRVVLFAPGVVRQHRVGLRQFAELGGCIGTGILIGMVLQRQVTVGVFN